MDWFANLAGGFETAVTLNNIMLCFIGVLLGTAIGVLPGVGPLVTIAILLPLTYSLEPTSALIMLSGIYYGAQYGGSTTAILVNLPGESGSVVTCIDGNAMARNGRAGSALAIAALGSFFAGTVGTLMIAAFSPYLSKIALSFGPADYFSLMVLGLVAAIVLASGGLLKAFGMILVGILLGSVGTDLTTGTARYTFGTFELLDGLEFTALAMGLFAIGDIIANASKTHDRSMVKGKVTDLWPNKQEFKEAWPAVLRGTALGSLLGLLPGGGATLSSFASYSIEKKLSKHPERFGKGAPAGVAAPESANNAGAQSAFIPMLTLGLPSNGVMAMMIGAMMIHNIVPGPEVMTRNADLFWGLVASMWIGNFLLVIINLPLIGIWVRLLRLPYNMLFPAILIFSLVGLYSIGNSSAPILMAAGFGILGYLFNRLGCEPAPLLLGFILGPMIEVYMRRALLLSKGDVSVFVTQPLSLVLLLTALALLISVLSPVVRRKREEVFVED
ncbi:tripartite tricarboxylate transporter permease [Rhizobium sp. CG4]|jgi:TctA family transporter|uniref:tripartite tricarboxylate transporter permease n=1 Tax=Rhizobium/Agrobacterium group TaxID=227290 RepID=UPI0017846D83|nr:MULTISPECIES: tripartite tricarboxylate transporter permease [Rhizobium/Agrobacterium group]MBD9389037.1 tripartite tricarboxylate transporter permease [Agrobacterium sp. AGB01]MCM2456374.1 tripartite tricarboxylate transporter permease [Rhizobium sp. CG4]